MMHIRPPRTIAAIFLFLLLQSVAWPTETIDEIVVTADYRGRTANELPASVTVFESDDIEDMAVQHFEELIYAVPNLNWSGDGNRARYFQIRGVGELEQYQGAPNPPRTSKPWPICPAAGSTRCMTDGRR